MDKLDNIVDKFQQDIGAVIDEYAERLVDEDPGMFEGDMKTWGNTHLILMLVLRDFAESNFIDVTGQRMPEFEYVPATEE